MGKIVLVIIIMLGVVVIGVPAGCNHLLNRINTSTVTSEAPVVANDLAEHFGIGIPAGYKGGFSMQMGFFGIQAANVISLIPEHAQAAEIFEGGKAIKFNPGEHTIMIALRSHTLESPEESRRSLQRLVLGSEQGEPSMTEVFIAAGTRDVAAYEHRSTRYGQQNLSYFIFLDDGGLLFLTGPADGFDHRLKQSVATGLADAWPANDLLYAHVEAPQRDPFHPCGFQELPDSFEIQAVGVRRGSTPLEDVAIDPEDDDAGAQAVAVGRTGLPVVLILMSGEPTVWKVMSTPDAQIAGVIASGSGIQRVIGLAEDVQLKELDPHDRNACPPFLAYEVEGRDYDRVADRIWEVFAQGIARMHTMHGGGYFRIGEVTAEPELRGSLRVEDVVLDPAEHLLPGALGLAQLKERGIIRPARPSDLDPWFANFESSGGFDPQRYRKRLSADFRMQRVFVITAPTDVPSGMYGANSALFMVAAGVPEPGGDLGHNTFLYADGRCAGPSCPR